MIDVTLSGPGLAPGDADLALPAEQPPGHRPERLEPVWPDEFEEFLILHGLANPPTPEPWQLDDGALLAEAATARRELAAAQARWLELLAEIERRGASVTVTAMPTSSWLSSGTSHSARAARVEVRLAQRLAELPQVANALAAGRVSLEQAQAIVSGLDHLPETIDRTQTDAVADHMVLFAQEFGPTALRRLVSRAVEVVAPEAAEEADRLALERADRRQHHQRYLAWRHTEDGSVAFHGLLPIVEGELLINHLGHLAARMRTADALSGVETSRPQALADALGLVLSHHARCEATEIGCGDWARVLVNLDLDTLLAGVGVATLVSSDESTTAGQARRLACTSGLVPAVFGDQSLPLDLGRARRLFSPTQRTAIALRDRGCVFPGCDRPPGDCDIHHIDPWSTGGGTDLRNGVTLCPHHHHLVEPDPTGPPEEQWLIGFDSRGYPELTSPIDPRGRRTLRQHARFRC